MQHKGHILKDLIKRSSYSIMKVADELSINRSQFSTMLNKPEIKSEVIERVCSLLGVDSDDYFSEEKLVDYQEKYYASLEMITELQAELIRLKDVLYEEKKAG